MSRSIAFINQKGGVGKTTLVANAGAWWGREGRRVLLIDLDPQSHLSLHFGAGGEPERERANIYRVLRGETRLEDAVVHLPAEKIDLIPSHIDLSAAEWELGQEVGREVILRDKLRAFQRDFAYDLVLIDCPPSLGLLSLNALAAVDEVVVPVQAEFFALQGMAQLMRVVDLVRSRLHPGLQWRVVVPTLVDTRTNLGREVIAELERHVPGKVTQHWLTKRVKVAEAPSFGQSIFAYAPESAAADEFSELCRELARRLDLPAPPPRGEPAAEIPAEGGIAPPGEPSAPRASSGDLAAAERNGSPPAELPSPAAARIPPTAHAPSPRAPAPPAR